MKKNQILASCTYFCSQGENNDDARNHSRMPVIAYYITCTISTPNLRATSPMSGTPTLSRSESWSSEGVTAVTQGDRLWQELLGVDPVLLDSTVSACSTPPRAGLLEEAGNSLFFYVLSNVSSFTLLGCSFLVSSEPECRMQLQRCKQEGVEA